MNKKISRAKLATLIITPLLSIESYAVGQSTGFKVVSVRADKSGFGYVKFDQPLIGDPATCTDTGYQYHLSFDLNKPGGNGIISIALAAQASGKSVIAKGTGTCDEYSVVESWHIGWVIDE